MHADIATAGKRGEHTFHGRMKPTKLSATSLPSATPSPSPPIRLPLRLITRCGLCSSSVCKERHVKEAYRCVALVNERTLMDIDCWVTRHPRRCTTARRELRCRTIGVGRRLAAAVARSPTRTKNTPEDKNPPDRSNKALEERDRPLRRRLTS